MIDKEKVKIHFNKNVTNYDKYAQVQKKMNHILIKTLLNDNSNNISDMKSILEIGCGTGQLTEMLLEMFPQSHITAIDLSPNMIESVDKRFKGKVNFICGDIEEIDLSEKYDLIISNATFQWFNDLSFTTEKLLHALKPSGTLCFSTFGENTFSELKECFIKTRISMGIKENILPGQTFYSSNEIKNIFDLNKYSVTNCETHEYEYFKDCKSFFHSIKKVGANNSNKENRCTSTIFLKNVMDTYDKTFRDHNKVKATYHCLFFKISPIT